MIVTLLKNIFAIFVSLSFVGAGYFFLLREGVGTAQSAQKKQIEEEIQIRMQVTTRLGERLSGLNTVNIETSLFDSENYPEFAELDGDFYTALPVLSGYGSKKNPFYTSSNISAE